MTTEYSIQKMVSDGTLSTIALGIQYLQRNDIYIRIAGEATPQSGASSGYTWSFLDNTTLKILPVVPNGVEVVVYRRTDVDAMYNIYSQNAQFDEATIDENNQQLLYIAQEYLEQGIPGAGVDTIEFLRDDGINTYYRVKRTDGSYSDEFSVPSVGTATKIIAREALRRGYAEAGFNLVLGSFEVGGTLVNPNDVLLYESNGKAFSGPAGYVPAGTSPTSSTFIDVSPVVTWRFKSVQEAVSAPLLSIGSRVVVDNYHFNGTSGILFFNVVAGGTGIADGGKYINTTNGLQLVQNLRLPMTPSAWGAEDDGSDSSVAINKMIAHFKRTLPVPAANKNYDAKGKGLDFSGRTYHLVGTIDASGIDNLSVYNPSLVAISGFVGTELIKFSSLEPTWYVENITLWNPYFDCNWNVDFGFDAADFLNLKVMGGKITHYRKKGFRTRRINVGPHEVNMTGTFIFQREYNETFPAGITEGEAFEIGNYDNNFTGVVVGYQKKWAFTLASGANMFSNCHIYSGVESWPESGVRSLDTADDFNGCYFDSVPLLLRNRSSVSDCYFVIEETKDFAIELTTTDPYQIKIDNNRFRKLAGTSVQAIKMKTIAEGRLTRPDIYNNTADGCTVLQTRGAHPVNISATSTTFALPDQYQPLSSLGPVYLAASADGVFQERMFGQAYNSTTKQITVNCYAVSGGSMVSSNLGGKQALINFNQ